MQKDNRWTGVRVMGVPRLTDARGEYRWATVAQIAEKRNVGQDRKVSEHTVHRGLLFMGQSVHDDPDPPLKGSTIGLWASELGPDIQTSS